MKGDTTKSAPGVTILSDATEAMFVTMIVKFNLICNQSNVVSIEAKYVILLF